MKSELYNLINRALREESTEAIDRVLEYFINNYPEIDEAIEWDEIRVLTMNDLEQLSFETAPIIVVREMVQHVKDNFDLAQSLYWHKFSEKYRTAFHGIIQTSRWVN